MCPSIGAAVPTSRRCQIGLSNQVNLEILQRYLDLESKLGIGWLMQFAGKANRPLCFLALLPCESSYQSCGADVRAVRERVSCNPMSRVWRGRGANCSVLRRLNIQQQLCGA
jgi:hypothetical protein